jgi:MFS family permease
MADIFGRTIAMEMALVTMLIGSGICTGAPLNAFPLLIFGRALQGLSVAGIGVISKTILADKVSLQENAKNTSIFSIFGGYVQKTPGSQNTSRPYANLAGSVSYAIGPVIGGYLTDSTWRWCFGMF